MAFNPLAGFAKYRRFWMATTLILVMVTFVLCTGKGDFGEMMLRWFQFGRTAMFRIDGTSYYRADFDKLQLQRKVANEFMTIYTRLTLDAIQERLRNPGDAKDAATKELITRLSTIREGLSMRQKKGKFFETYAPAEAGESKVDDVINYRIWLAEADRLGVYLQPKAVEEMINMDLLKYAFKYGDLDLWTIERTAFAEVQRAHGGDRVNTDFIFDSLKNEYRARIAQLADAELQFRTVEPRWQYKRTAPPGFLPQQVRTPTSPGILWDSFQESRKEFDVVLMPLPVSAFTDEIPEPDLRKLQELFEKGKKTPYDPASDQPGFLKSHQVKVQYVTADPSSPFFKKIVQTANVMTQYPVGSFTPQMPLATALTFAAGSSMFDSMLEKDYMTRVRQQLVTRAEYLGGSTLAKDPSQSTLVYLSRKNPISIAAMIGAAAPSAGLLEGETAVALPALFARTAIEKKDVLQAAAKAQAKTMAPIFAAIVADGAMPTGIMPYAELNNFGRKYLFDPDFNVTPTLPFTVVRPEVLRDYDLRMAGKMAIANMAFFKKELEVPHRIGDAAQVDRLLKRYGRHDSKTDDDSKSDYRDLGLQVVETDKYYDRYTIKDAPELKPLLEAFQTYYTMVNQAEGRDVLSKLPGDLPRNAPLRDDDFWRLFFDSAEGFSLQKRYEAKPWPPVIRLGTPEQLEFMLETAKAHGERLPVPAAELDEMRRQAHSREANKDITFNLFATAERPFLFWKVDERQVKVPDSLDDVKGRVVEAYKMQQARESKVLPYAKKLAESLLAGNGDYVSLLRNEKFGKDLVSFQQLAPMYRDPRSGAYDEFKLPRDSIRFPREDMVAELLALNSPKKPIETGNVELDKLNRALFDDAQKKNLAGDRYIQVLANKPRDTYYLAVVQLNRGASKDEFYDSVLPGAADGRNRFFEKVQEKMGDEHYRALMVQLRENHRYRPGDDMKKVDDPGQ